MQRITNRQRKAVRIKLCRYMELDPNHCDTFITLEYLKRLGNPETGFNLTLARLYVDWVKTQRYTIKGKQYYAVSRTIPVETPD